MMIQKGTAEGVLKKREEPPRPPGHSHPAPRNANAVEWALDFVALVICPHAKQHRPRGGIIDFIGDGRRSGARRHPGRLLRNRAAGLAAPERSPPCCSSEAAPHPRRPSISAPTPPSWARGRRRSTSGRSRSTRSCCARAGCSWYWPEAGIGTSDGTGAVAKLVDPKTQTVQDASIPFAYDAFCGGHTVLADGRVFVAGGTAYAASQLDGTAQTATFEPRDQLWTPGASMTFPRWYPSTTELPNGDVLIMSGREYLDGTTIPEVERFRHRTGRSPRSRRRPPPSWACTRDRFCCPMGASFRPVRSE